MLIFELKGERVDGAASCSLKLRSVTFYYIQPKISKYSPNYLKLDTAHH